MKQSGRLFQPEPRNSKTKLSGQVIIRAKQIHCNDLHSTADGSIIIIAKKAISNNRLCSAFKDSDDIEIFKALYG